MEKNVHLVSFKPGTITLRLKEGAPSHLPQILTRFLETLTKTKWQVILSKEAGHPTLETQSIEERQALEGWIDAHPSLQDLKRFFPGLALKDIKKPSK